MIDTTAAFRYLQQVKDLPAYPGHPLLIPKELEVPAAMTHSLEELSPLLKQLGIEATPFSPKSILIHSHPSGISENELFDLVREVFLLWQEDLPLKRIERVATLFGKKRMDQEEALLLIQKLEQHPPQKGIVQLITGELLDKWLKK